MANLWFDGLQIYGRHIKVITGTFAPQGSSAPTITAGLGWTVVRTSAGVFTITLNDSYKTLIGKSADIAMNAATDLNPQWGAIDVTTAKTLVLRSLAAGVATDIAANANNQVSFTLFLKNSTVGPT